MSCGLHDELVILMEDEEFAKIIKASIDPESMSQLKDGHNRLTARVYVSDIAHAIIAMAKVCQKRTAKLQEQADRIKDLEAEVTKLQDERTKSENEKRNIIFSLMGHIKHMPAMLTGFRTFPMVAEHQSTMDPSQNTWIASLVGNQEFPLHRWFFRRATIQDIAEVQGTISGYPAQIAGIEVSEDGKTWRAKVTSESTIPSTVANSNSATPGGPFMVIGPKNEVPTVEHPTLEAAATECRRLCKRTPGKGMVVQVMQRMRSEIVVEESW